MNTRLLLPVLTAAALLAGCETESPIERVRQQVTGDYPSQHRTFQADERHTYAAARQALKALDFTFTRGGPAQGVMNAHSAINPGEHVGTVHQFGLHAEFQTGLDGKSTDVTVTMTETQADDVNGKLGSGAETPLRDTSLYEAFFRSIQASLNQPDMTEAQVAAPVAK